MSFLLIALVVLAFVVLIIYMIKNHVTINLKSFFQKGFKLIKDQFRVLLLVW